MKTIKRVLLNGTIVYENEYGELHREDGPAVIWPSGREFWFINGKRHREDGPAYISLDGSKHYWLKGNIYSYEEWLELVKDPISRKWREFCEVN